MFRGFNLENNDNEFKAVLHINRRDALCEIDNSFIENVKYNLEEINEMTLNIPKFIGKDKRFNELYLKIKPRQQIVVTETTKLGEVIKSRFVLLEPSKSVNKNSGNKKIVAKSWEYTLKDKRKSFEGKVFQLKSDETIKSDGLLDVFIKSNPDYKIGYVDPLSKVEERQGAETISELLFTDYKKDKITDGSIIWEKDVTTNVVKDMPLYLSFSYDDLKTYNADGTLLIQNDIFHPIIEPLYTDIKHIKAKHHSSEGARFSIKYEFTLVDDVVETRICNFTNVIDKNIACREIKLLWETSKIITNTFVKVINVESIDTDWLSILQELIPQFNSVVRFDSFNKTINVIHKDNIGKSSGYLLSYQSNVTSIESFEESQYPNCMRVIGKNGMSIVSENIFGGDYIYDMTYAKLNGLMSDELITNWERYEKYLVLKQDEFNILKNEKMAINQRKTKTDSEIKSLNTRILYLNNLLSAYISGEKDEGENQKRIATEIEDLKTKLAECLRIVTVYKEQIQVLDDNIMKISKSIKRENATDSKGKIFTDNDIDDLYDIASEVVEFDEYYSTPYGLLTNYKKVLHDMQTPKVEYKIETSNLSKVIKSPKGAKGVLVLGDLFSVDKEITKEFGIEDTTEFRLLSYEYSPKDGMINNPVFGNKMSEINIKKSLGNIGKKTNDNSNVINSWGGIIEDAMLKNDWVGAIIENGLDLTASQIKGLGMKNYITIDESGIFLQNQLNKDEQLYLGSSVISFSNDSFKTSEIALTKDGLIAKTLVGSIILGERLFVTSDTFGEFYIGDTDENGFGMQIKDSDSKSERIFIGIEENKITKVREAKLRITSKDGKKTIIDENGLLNTLPYVYPLANVDSSKYPLDMRFFIPETTNVLHDIRLNIHLGKYRVFETGLTASGSSTSTSSNSGGAYSQEQVTNSSEANGDHTHVMFSKSGGGEIGPPYPSLYTCGENTVSISVVNNTSDLTTKGTSGNHSHEVYIPAISIPSHSHETTINLEHNHEISKGITESDGASEVELWLDGEKLPVLISVDTEVNLTPYMTKNFKGWHNLQAKSKTLGGISAVLIAQCFLTA